jgi:hypothetical protein
VVHARGWRPLFLAVADPAAAPTTVEHSEWADDLPVSARLRLGIGRRAPSESMIRRILQMVDLEALDVALSSWLVARLLPGVRSLPASGRGLPRQAAGATGRCHPPGMRAGRSGCWIVMPQLVVPRRVSHPSWRWSS